MKKYDVLLFDLDYTLLDFDADMTMAFEKLYKKYGFDKKIPYSKDMLDLYESFNNKWWRIFESGGCTKQELFINRFDDFLRETGLGSGETLDLTKMNDDYFGFLGAGGMAYDGALEMLERLSENYRIYITTNGNADTAKTRIANSGVGKFIKGYFVSEAIGAAKPSEKYFEYVAEHVPDFDRENTVVIGDSLLSDITGAANFGLDSIYYRPAGRQDNDENTPQFTYLAESFEEIIKILE